MTVFRKHAWFHLIVSGATLLAVGTLLLATSNPTAAMAGFAILAATGFGEMYFRRGKHTPCRDERDEHNDRLAVRIAYSVFWLCGSRVCSA